MYNQQFISLATFFKKDIDDNTFANLLQLCCIGLKRRHRFKFWRTLIYHSNKKDYLNKIEHLVQKLFEMISSLDTMNEDSFFQVQDLKIDCFIRSTKA